MFVLLAPQRSHFVKFGQVGDENRGKNPMKQNILREDPWFWLRDDKRENKEILSHLEAENAYTTSETKHLDGLRKTLYDEHLSHLQVSSPE